MKYKDTIEKWAKEHHLEEKVKNLFPILESFDQRSDLFNILQNDVKSANDAVGRNPENQYLRRTLVRTHFAMIEGLLNILNQAVLDAYSGKFIHLSATEIDKLNESRSKNGEVRPDFMSVNKKLTFSFRIFAQKLGEFDYSIDISSTSWEQFEKAVSVRNRLMHPRKLDDMTLDEGELSLIIGVSTWFLDLYGDLQRKVGDATSKRSMEKLIKARAKGIQSGK